MSMSGHEFGTLRERSGVTQGDVGRQAGVSARQVWNWEHSAELSPKVAARAMRALKRAAAHEDADPEEPEPGLAEMSNAALVAQMQQILGILAARLEDPTLKGEPGSGFGQEASEVRERTVHGPTVPEPPRGGAIRGRMGVPPRTAD